MDKYRSDCIREKDKERRRERDKNKVKDRGRKKEKERPRTADGKELPRREFSAEPDAKKDTHREKERVSRERGNRDRGTRERDRRRERGGEKRSRRKSNDLEPRSPKKERRKRSSSRRKSDRKRSPRRSSSIESRTLKRKSERSSKRRREKTPDIRKWEEVEKKKKRKRSKSKTRSQYFSSMDEDKKKTQKLEEVKAKEKPKNNESSKNEEKVETKTKDREIVNDDSTQIKGSREVENEKLPAKDETKEKNSKPSSPSPSPMPIQISARSVYHVRKMNEKEHYVMLPPDYAKALQKLALKREKKQSLEKTGAGETSTGDSQSLEVKKLRAGNEEIKIPELNVVFVDCDGVLKPHSRKDNMLPGSTHLNILRRLLKQTKSKVVISSAWRRDPNSLALLIDVLRSSSTIPKTHNVIGITRPTANVMSETNPNLRAKLILEWIRHCPMEISSWLALDDTDLGLGGLDQLNFIRTNGDKGLEEKHIEEAISKMQSSKAETKRKLKELDELENYADAQLPKEIQKQQDETPLKAVEEKEFSLTTNSREELPVTIDTESKKSMEKEKQEKTSMEREKQEKKSIGKEKQKKKSRWSEKVVKKSVEEEQSKSSEKQLEKSPDKELNQGNNNEEKISESVESMSVKKTKENLDVLWSRVDTMMKKYSEATMMKESPMQNSEEASKSALKSPAIVPDEISVKPAATKPNEVSVKDGDEATKNKRNQPAKTTDLSKKILTKRRKSNSEKRQLGSIRIKINSIISAPPRRPSQAKPITPKSLSPTLLPTSTPSENQKPSVKEIPTSTSTNTPVVSKTGDKPLYPTRTEPKPQPSPPNKASEQFLKTLSKIQKSLEPQNKATTMNHSIQSPQPLNGTSNPSNQIPQGMRPQIIPSVGPPRQMQTGGKPLLVNQHAMPIPGMQQQGPIVPQIKPRMQPTPQAPRPLMPQQPQVTSGVPPVGNRHPMQFPPRSNNIPKTHQGIPNQQYQTPPNGFMMPMRGRGVLHNFGPNPPRPFNHFQPPPSWRGRGVRGRGGHPQIQPRGTPPGNFMRAQPQRGAFQQHRPPPTQRGGFQRPFYPKPLLVPPQQKVPAVNPSSKSKTQQSSLKTEEKSQASDSFLSKLQALSSEFDSKKSAK